MNDESRRPQVTIDAAAHIENEVRRALRPFDPAHQRPYVGLAHVEQVEEAPVVTPPSDAAADVGGMAAEAVLQQYEATAKRVEEMGEEVKARIAKLQQAMTEANHDLGVLGKAAEAIQAKGKAVSEMIEVASNMSKLIRDACADFQVKVGNGN